MTNTENIINNPIFFEENRVGRVYTGGALFAGFFGDGSTDGFEPEEWVASSVAAINKVSKGPKEGVSCIENTGLYFDDLLETNTEALLGGRKIFGVLTKVLDSAIRLPVQAHPDREFSKKYFNSGFGKAESWVVLATRPGAEIYFGFNRPVTKKELSDAVKAAQTDKTAMESLLNAVEVKPGDVFFVPAGMVHAIGRGCLILEIQEPTDFTIQPECWCGDYRLNDKEMYIGLDHDIALDVFDYSVYGAQAVEKGRKTPRLMYDKNSVKAESLISYDDTPCFAVNRYTLNNTRTQLNEAPAVYVVTDGQGELLSPCGKRKIKKGDYFFLPHAAKDKTEISTGGEIQYIVCLPPL